MPVKLTPVILFVRYFDRCLKFYEKVFGLELKRLYRGKGHPPWAEFQVGDIRFALHAGYKGPAFRQWRPLALHFDVKDIRRTLAKIKRYGGKIKQPIRKLDFRPEELQLAYAAAFADPDGNVFEVQQVLKKFRK